MSTLVDCDYDVVIAGGGMVGASLALQLNQLSGQQLKVLVVESFPLGEKTESVSYSPSFDARSTALSYGSRLLLESLGVWDALSEHVAAINTIHVSDRGRLGSTSMSCEQVRWPSLGYVVENAWLGNVLLGELRNKTNVDFLAPASVTAIAPRRGKIEFTIVQNEKKRNVSAQLAVIADGAKSGLRDKLGIDTQVRDYQQTALIANVSFRKPHRGYAYERFTGEGPMALLPLTDTEQGEPRSALVWSLSKQRAEHLCKCDENEFLLALQQSFGHRQGEFTRVGERGSYPLALVQASEQVRTGIVVMGNAAHSLHPVAGQGFNLALRDCARLSRLLADAFQQQKSLGDLALLSDYVEQQSTDQQKTIAFSDRLPDVFSTEQWPVNRLRGAGLGLLDIIPALKSDFIHHAAGMNDGAVVG